MISEDIAKIKNDFFQEGVLYAKQQWMQEGMQLGRLSSLYDLVASGDLAAEAASRKMAECSAGART